MGGTTLAEELLTAEEVAPLLRTSPDGVNRYVRNGLIPAELYVQLGRKRLFKKTLLEAWIAAGGTSTSQVTENTSVS